MRDELKEMTNQISDMMENIIGDERMLPLAAQMIRKMYEELIKVGFSEDQATIIAANYKAT